MKLPKTFSKPYWGWMLIILILVPIIVVFIYDGALYLDYYFEYLFVCLLAIISFNLLIVAIRLIGSEKKDDDSDGNPLSPE